jgi:hypothetical protein
MQQIRTLEDLLKVFTAFSVDDFAYAEYMNRKEAEELLLELGISDKIAHTKYKEEGE